MRFPDLLCCHFRKLFAAVDTEPESWDTRICCPFMVCEARVGSKDVEIGVSRAIASRIVVRKKQFYNGLIREQLSIQTPNLDAQIAENSPKAPRSHAGDALPTIDSRMLFR